MVAKQEKVGFVFQSVIVVLLTFITAIMVDSNRSFKEGLEAIQKNSIAIAINKTNIVAIKEDISEIKK